MPFIVEDGSNVTDANSLCDVAFADDYFTLRGITEWTDLENSSKEIALIKATDYVNNVFEFKGYKIYDDQSLKFPRVIIGFTAMPEILLKSICEYALISLNSNLMPNLIYESTGQPIKSTSKELKGLKSSIEYFEHKEPIEQRSYPYPDKLIKPLLSGNINYLTR